LVTEGALVGQGEVRTAVIQQINPMYVNFAVSLRSLEASASARGRSTQACRRCRCCQRESGDG
jgi:hypothetical protein